MCTVMKMQRPIAYKTNQTMSEAEYDRLDSLYNQLVFTRYAVTKDGTVSAEQVKKNWQKT